MKKTTLTAFVLLFMCHSAWANPNAQLLQGILDQMRSTIASECADEAALSCMDMSASECMKIKEGILDNCTKPALSNLADLSEKSFDQAQAENLECTIGYVTKEHDIDLQKFVSCVGADSFDADDLKTINNN